MRLLLFSRKHSINLILMTYFMTLPAAAQVKMPQEAERIYQQSDLSEFPLSEFGQRLALTSFGFRYLTDVILTRAHEILKECEKNTPPDAECRKSGICCKEEKKTIDRLNMEVAEYDKTRVAAYHAWEEQWFSWVGIAYFKDTNGNIIVAESGKKRPKNIMTGDPRLDPLTNFIINQIPMTK